MWVSKLDSVETEQVGKTVSVVNRGSGKMLLERGSGGTGQQLKSDDISAANAVKALRAGLLACARPRLG